MAQTKILVFEGNKTFFKNIEVDEVFADASLGLAGSFELDD